MRVRRRLLMLIFIAVSVAIVILIVQKTSQHGDDHEEKTLSDRLPELKKYRDIPLPVTAPPSGALVLARSFADPQNDGQHIAFQYPGFTVQACTVRKTSNEPDACTPQSGASTIRTVDEARLTTLFTVSSKGSLPTEARKVVEFFETAPLERRPAWMSTYAEEMIEEYYG